MNGEELVNIQPWTPNEGHWKSLLTVLPGFSGAIATEEMTNHPVLGYRGKFDCIALHRLVGFGWLVVV